MVFSILSVILLLNSASLNAAADINLSNSNNSGVNLPGVNLTVVNLTGVNLPETPLQAPGTILEYMLQLRKELADSNGKPKLANIKDPTEVWALQDADILQGKYRRKPRAEEQCISTYQFFFSLESMVSPHKVEQEKSILRTYMKFNSRLLEVQKPTVVTIEVYMKNDSVNVLAGVNSVPATAQFSQWVEINVTDGIRVFWPPIAEDTDLEVTLILRIDCQLNLKVPAIIINPATISLDRAVRRERKLLFQPYLVVYLSDETIKSIVRNQSIATSTDGDLGIVRINKKNTTNNETRKKRYSSTSGCHIEDFFVDFELIEIRYIEAPMGYNAKQCRGSCDHNFLSLYGGIGNNHAKIMAGARKLHDISVSSSSSDLQFNTEPKGPCCVPTIYSSMTVIEMDSRALKYTVYPSMVVEACGCR